jgi:hypothetical protein
MFHGRTYFIVMACSCIHVCTDSRDSNPCKSGADRIMSVMITDFWLNDTDGIKPKYSGINLLQCHIAHQKFLLYLLGNEPAPSRWQAESLKNYGWQNESVGSFVFGVKKYVCVTETLLREVISLRSLWWTEHVAGTEDKCECRFIIHTICISCSWGKVVEVDHFCYGWHDRILLKWMFCK